jgi:RsiW-degrading membrane proteinase PrsW (M82 family)
MTKTLITAAAVAVALGFFSAPSFAKSYIVNGHAASAAEVQHLVSHGFQPGAWTVSGFAITAADAGASVQPAVESNAKKCWYVLDVQLCD